MSKPSDAMYPVTNSAVAIDPVTGGVLLQFEFRTDARDPSKTDTLCFGFSAAGFAELADGLARHTQTALEFARAGSQQQ